MVFRSSGGKILVATNITGAKIRTPRIKALSLRGSLWKMSRFWPCGHLGILGS